MVDFGATKPYPAYLREHSPDYETYNASRARKVTEGADAVPAFRPASDLIREPSKPPASPRSTVDVAHEDAETTATHEAGRAWASGQLVFNAGQFESARSGFVDYARDGESAKELRARVNRTILEDLEEKILALRALHAKLREAAAGESFGEIVGRGRPRSGIL